jgi:hypothetical protein
MFALGRPPIEIAAQLNRNELGVCYRVLTRILVVVPHEIVDGSSTYPPDFPRIVSESISTLPNQHRGRRAIKIGDQIEIFARIIEPLATKSHLAVVRGGFPKETRSMPLRWRV